MKYQIKWNWNLTVNITIGFLFLFVALPRVEKWIFGPAMEGVSAPIESLLDLSGRRVFIPIAGENQILIFWATWCGPCSVELEMYNRAVRNGALPSDRVLAISMGESIESVVRAVRDRDYKFTVYVDPGGVVSQIYQVQATPTSVFVDRRGQVKTFSMGMSPLVFLRAKSFLSLP